MVKITYPGTGNYSTFGYDNFGRTVSIVETNAGSVTSTKQFVWAKDDMRLYQPCEERDGSGTLTKKFFGRGQVNSVTKYFYTKDHLGSVREMTDNTGTIQAQYGYDLYGQPQKIAESIPADFQYAEYYLHVRSVLNLTLHRAFNSRLGRFISRDPVAERGGTNLYNYVNGDPVANSDPLGYGCNADYECCTDADCCDRMAQQCLCNHPGSTICCLSKVNATCHNSVMNGGTFPGTSTWATCKTDPDKGYERTPNKAPNTRSGNTDMKAFLGPLAFGLWVAAAVAAGAALGGPAGAAAGAAGAFGL